MFINIKFKKYIATLLILTIVLSNIIITNVVRADTSSKMQHENIINLLEKRYYIVLDEWHKNGITEVDGFYKVIPASDFILKNNAYIIKSPKNEGYKGDAVNLQGNSEVDINIDVENSGLYTLAFDYYPVDPTSENFESSIKINNVYQYYELRRIVFPFEWKYDKKVFERDRYQNQILPQQVKVFKWYNNVNIQDPMHLYDKPIEIYLQKGKNTISFKNIGESVILGNCYIKSQEKIIDYDKYLGNTKNEIVNNFFSEYGAEHIYSKNNLRTRIKAEKDPDLTPYNVKYDLFNIIDGKSWNRAGDLITWEITVEKSGFYNISFKARQDQKINRPVFRTLYIDNKIPFKEAEHIMFPFTNSWKNYSLSNVEGNSYKIYLTKGIHFISLEVDASLFREIIDRSTEIIQQINDLSLEIKKLTGNNIDPNRDWVIMDYIPDVKVRLENWQKELKLELKILNDLNSSNSTEATFLKMAINQLEILKSKPNEIPKRLTILSEGSSSVLEYLSTIISNLEDNPLSINKLYIYGDKAVLPVPNVGLFEKLKDSFERFILSFKSNPYQLATSTGNEINIWVNRPRSYVELMQKMADNEFTSKTGYKVNFSVMPDEGKLILASAAGEQPDAALGISNWLPYELAIRGAVYNLRNFEDFDKYINIFSPGAFLPYIIDDKVYAIPETQDFWVLFYRKDIFDKLNLPVPNDWNDVIKILPELQRYGMNFYDPIAGYGGFKPFMVTVPFIYQYDGQLYNSNGMSTAINSENDLKGIELMSNLFTTYSMPMQVPNFYNHFRYGTLPVGISNFTTYVQLLTAAPEIKGLWDISLYPGVENKQKVVERWAPGSAQSCVIFNKSNKKQKTWEFLKWWMSTDIQTEFANNLRLSYGEEYMWNTANIDAFKKLPWDKNQKEVILNQWQWLKEVPKTPGSYMLEREISNVWNKIVFDGENPRSAIDDASIVVNREIRRKMEEFGYIKNGEIVKPYKIPTVEMVEGWMKHDK